MPAHLSRRSRPRPAHLAGLGVAACLTLAAVTLPMSPSSAQQPTAANALHTPARSAWVATATHALDLKGTALGAAPSQRLLRISVALPLRHRAQVDRTIEALSNPASPSYGHFLTRAQVLHRFGPTARTADAVTSYLRDAGLTHVSVDGNRLLVNATATVAQAERAFDTSISTFRVGGQRVYANTRAASVPRSLDGKVTAVLGLSNYAMPVPDVVQRGPRATAASPDLSGFLPNTIAKVYQANKMKAAKDATVSVVAAGDLTPIIANLRYAEKKEHYPQVPVKAIYTAPKDAITHDNPLSGNAEWDLDVQMSTFMAQKVKRLEIYDIATFTDSDVTHAINRFVSDDSALTLSASLGECDTLAWADGSLTTTDEAIAEGGLQGQSVFASTGDNGSFCPEGASTGVPGGGPGQSWPAVGEYTTAVGGTTLLADDQGHVTSEVSWVGGGGGVSTWANAAPWTLQASTAGQLAEYNNFGGRGVPDVAAVADGNTGVLIYAGGKDPEVVGGTSVSSPLVSGLWARIEQAHQLKLGLASYRFYRLYNHQNPATVAPGLVPTYVPDPTPTAVKGFTDITLGVNGAYASTPGWDYNTGIGTLRCQDLSTALAKG